MKHWHGRNRAKNTHISQEEFEIKVTCHLCGAMDSQTPAFRSCTHNNISAVREQTYEALQVLIEVHREETRNNAQNMAILKRNLFTGILHELRTSTDATRARTGNGSRWIITWREVMLEIDHLVRKHSTALRKTLQNSYQVISQGANDILTVGYDIAAMQMEQRRCRHLSQQNS